ncbi:MAG: HAMP domain-containing sensor histidine kinase [Pseudomonadota bacterium]
MASDPSAAKRKLRWRNSLSFRLFLIAISTVLIVEALIFIPSATNFRNNWLNDQIEAGRLAALALEAAPSRMVSEELEQDLLNSAMVLAVAELYDERRDMILNPGKEICCTRRIVLYDASPDHTEIMDTLATFFAPRDRFLIIRAAGSQPGRVIEIVVDEKGLRSEMEAFGLNILGLSLLISIVTGGLIYLMLLMTVVRPIRRVTQSVEQIKDEPGSWKRRLAPTMRSDEIGRAQNALSDMEEAVSNAFRQQERLAQLGEAVAKINHDLRNSLATAQLVSDTLSRSEDPRVAKSLPRLERALERAINLASDTLKYGRSSVPETELQSVRVHDVIEEAALEALAAFPEIAFRNHVVVEAQVTADPDHLHRICANLIRNAAEALSGQGDALPAAGEVSVGFDGAALSVVDNGPGLPKQARDNLFKPFAGSTRRDGTGLGLALSRDLARAMGGDLQLGETSETGTRFVVFLP